MKFIDNRRKGDTFEEFGSPITAFEYEEMGGLAGCEFAEYGIHTSNGYTLSFEDGELEHMLEMVNAVKLQKRKESMLK